MKKTLQKWGAVLLSTTLCLPLLGGWSTGAAVDSTVQSLAVTGVVDTNLADYETLEALVMYRDHSTQVLHYATAAALEDGLAALQTDSNVLIVQPNYEYSNAALSVDDALADQQWALENDGSFSPQQSNRQYPVYENPFEQPTQPGQWHTPMPGGRGHGMSVTAASTSASAVSGIDINAQQAWDVYGDGNRDTIIALIDTGVDYTNTELSDAIWTNTDEIAGNGVDDDGNGYIDDVYGWNFYNSSNKIYVGEEDDHGTHCAGTMVAAADNGTGIAGIIPGNHVKIMVLKVLGGSDGSGTTDSVISAIQYAQANGADIVNLSLGSSSNDQAMYQAMADANLLFVIAAGNGSDTSGTGMDIDTSPIYPAAYDLDNLIAVANLNYDGTLHYSSNYGKTAVDLAAPGTYILSTTTQDTYSYMTGTSMAAPMVTAAAALLYSYDADLTLPQTKELLLQTTKPLDVLQGVVATGGMLDLGAAIAYDTDTLSDAAWNNADTTTVVTSGNTPVITTEIITKNGESLLKVSVSDADGDLLRVAYASGNYGANSFTTGAGKTFSLNSQGYTLFRITHSGTYTFYAVDLQGHETVKPVTLTAA